MKITAIESAAVHGNFDWILVRVHTDEGVSGIGEAYWGAGVYEILQTPAVTDLIVGLDPRDVEPLFTHLKRRLVGAGSVSGTMVTALSGIEIALWDLAGKAAGLPVYRLLGGKFRDRIRIYADCGFHGSSSSGDALSMSNLSVVKPWSSISRATLRAGSNESHPWNPQSA